MNKLIFAFLLFFGAAKIASAQHDTVINPSFNILENSQSVFSAMNKLKFEKNNPDSGFVVAHFGDSHIEGDFISGVIRKNLQSVFRSAGEGILFPYTVCKGGYGPKSLTAAIVGNWDCASITKNPNKYPIGISGHTLVSTDKKATISFVYNPTSEIAYGNNKIIERVTIWQSTNNFRLILMSTTNASGIYFDSTKNANGLCCTIISNYKVGTELKFRFDTLHAGTQFNFHGISFENPSVRGLQYNRCGAVGATFLQLIDDADFTLNQLHQIHPDLLIFSYGSNESYNTNFSIDDYYQRVTAFIQRIKKEFPNINIIFTDTPDTHSRDRIPPNTIPINEKLKLIATENKCAFWDLNKIMGGFNSYAYWCANSLMGKDKLHFTKTGYTLQANLFSLAFFETYVSNYDSSAMYMCDSLHFIIEKQLEALNVKTPSVNSTEQIHIVQKNETLATIAKQYNVSVAELCTWNNLTPKTVLHVNQKILVKKK